MAATLRTAFKMDEAMKRLEARTGGTADQMARMKRLAYEIGSQLTLNNDEIVKAQTAFFQRGNTIEETMAATPVIARLAVAAEGVSVEDVARYLSIAKNNFKLTSDELALLGDQMLKMETVTAGAFRSIGEAFQFSGQTAVDAGLNAAEYVSLLGAVAGAGREVESVSQGLNNVWIKIATAITGRGRGSKMVREAFSGLNIDLGEVKGFMAAGQGGFNNLLRLIGERAPSQADLTTSMRALAGESYASAISYMVQNMDKADAALEAAVGQGALPIKERETTRQLEIIMSGFSGAIKIVMAQWDTLKNVLADLEFSGPVAEAARALASLITWLTRTNDKGEYLNRGLIAVIGSTLELGVAMIALGVALKGVAWLLGGYLGVLRSLRWVIQYNWKETRLFAIWTRIAGASMATSGRSAGLFALALSGIEKYLIRLRLLLAFVGVKGAIVAVSAGLKGAMVGGLAAVLAAMGPIGWAVAAVVAGAALIYLAWRPISTFFAGVWQGLVDGTGEVGDALGRLGEAFGLLLDNLGPIGTGIRIVFEGVVALAGWGTGAVVDLWDWMVGRLDYDASGEGRQVGAFIIDGLVAVIDTITDVVEAYSALVGLLLTPFQAAWAAIVEFTSTWSLEGVGAAMVRTFTEGISSRSGEFYEAVRAVLGRAADWILPDFNAPEPVPAGPPIPGERAPARPGTDARRVVAGPPVPAGQPAPASSTAPTAPTAATARTPAVAGTAPTAATAQAGPVSPVAPIAPTAPTAPTAGEAPATVFVPGPAVSGPVLEAAPPPILPVAGPPIPAHLAAGAGGGGRGDVGPRSYHFENQIIVNAEGADSKEIAQNLGEVLRDQFQSVSDDADSDVALP